MCELLGTFAFFWVSLICDSAKSCFDWLFEEILENYKKTAILFINFEYLMGRANGEVEPSVNLSLIKIFRNKLTRKENLFSVWCRLFAFVGNVGNRYLVPRMLS